MPHLQSFLIKNKANWIEENLNLVYQMSFEDDSLLTLQKFCTELVSKKREKTFKSPDFTSIPEKSLVSFIQDDNPRMDEAQKNCMKELFKGLLKGFLNNNNNNKPIQKSEIIIKKSEPKITKEVPSTIFNSKIITLQHVELISKWIDGLEITDKKKNSYEFKLMLRGSREGLSPREFHEV